MDKKELKKRLLDAGISEEAIDERLKEVSEEQLAQLGDIPDATLLKEFNDSDDDDGVAVEFTSLMTAIKEIIREEVESALDGFQVEIEGFDQTKEVPGLVELKEAVADLAEKVEYLSQKEDQRLKDVLESTSRKGKLFIKRSKEMDKDEDEEEEEDVESLSEKLGVTKETLNWIKNAGPRARSGDEIRPVDSQGNEYASMTEMIHGISQ